jgi:glutamine synthetase adenylyltransferase
MRKRLEQSGGPELNLKFSPGGMYDVDFIAKYLTVRSALGVQTQNIRRRLDGLVAQGALNAALGRELANAGELIRVTEHAIRLATGLSRSTLPVGEHARAATEELVGAFLQRRLPLGLEPELRRTMARTREIYDHLLQ